MEQYNLEGPPLLKKLPDPPPLSPIEFQKRIKHGAVIVDIRTPSAFSGAHIKDSYNIWLKGIPKYAGWVLPYDKVILLVLDNRDKLETVIRYLVRLGYDCVEGYLCSGEECGLESWYIEALPTDHLCSLTVQELKSRLNQRDKLIILDVRSDKEWIENHIEHSIHIYIGDLEERLNEIPQEKSIAVI
jgi:hydroxyacylglutathione hydrolase